MGPGEVSLWNFTDAGSRLSLVVLGRYSLGVLKETERERSSRYRQLTLPQIVGEQFYHSRPGVVLEYVLGDLRMTSNETELKRAYPNRSALTYPLRAVARRLDQIKSMGSFSAANSE